MKEIKVLITPTYIEGYNKALEDVLKEVEDWMMNYKFDIDYKDICDVLKKKLNKLREEQKSSEEKQR
jgi:hypothetical protein